MIGIEHIVLYICMLQVIFRHLTGTLAAKVSINQNITGLLGSNDTHLTCSFFLEKGEQMLSVQINAKNITEDFDNVTMPIAIFIPWKTAKLLPLGTYLSSRVTLTNITTTSTNATMTFHKLKCTDEKDYMCKLYYNDNDSDTSNVTRILVKASPSMPDGISSFIVSPKKTETEVTPTSYIFRDSNKTSTRTNQNSSASFPALLSYLKALTILESPIYIRGGDILMLTCTGNIGKPPGKLLWQKISLQQNKSITYANITTYVEEIPGRCSFKGTSNLTVQISADDLKVKFRCFEESQANVAGMYVETEPFDVHSNKSLPTAEPESRKIFSVNGAYAIPVFYEVVVLVLCFTVRKRYSKREKMK
ncbi:uncharacterized protein LOC127713055 isoform X2 [Mytilus californianus]|uniref:uncharacterized protein LOC127713055 isoform X2 n=1 Tax=Mytilus californianus TaxID=6549 RepID=UPI0022481B72|nr:uncharacterized protein LOC127713055 isoform X2 [Mytilus californianus]